MSAVEFIFLDNPELKKYIQNFTKIDAIIIASESVENAVLSSGVIIFSIAEAISSLPPMQARRVHARYMLGMKVKDIAAMEGITPSQAGKSIHAALRRLRRYFARQKWTVNL